MKWLSDVDYRMDHEGHSRNILKGSGDWMLNGENEFQTWKEKGTVLWLHGIAGAGKTKLTSTIIDHLASSTENHTVTYFYCMRDTKHAEPEEILRAILKQLIILLPSQHSLLVKDKFERERRAVQGRGAIRRLTFDDCAYFILKLASDHPVTIVIDGLDECRKTAPRVSQGSHKDRKDLLDQLRKMVDTEGGKIKAFLSSRDDHDIQHQLQSYPNIILNSSKNGNDIRNFIVSKVDELVEKTYYLQNNENLKEEIIKAVYDRADGIFRSAVLQTDFF